MVTPSEGCGNGIFYGVVGSIGIIPGVFLLQRVGLYVELNIFLLALLVLMMFWLYLSVLMQLDLHWHQIFLLIFVRLPHGFLGMFDSLF